MKDIADTLSDASSDIRQYIAHGDFSDDDIMPEILRVLGEMETLRETLDGLGWPRCPNAFHIGVKTPADMEALAAMETMKARNRAARADANPPAAE